VLPPSENVAADAYYSVCIVSYAVAVLNRAACGEQRLLFCRHLDTIGISYEQEQKVVYVVHMGSRESDTFLGRKFEVKKLLGRTGHRWGTLKLILKSLWA